MTKELQARISQGSFRFARSLIAVAVAGTAGLATAQSTTEEINTPSVYQIKAPSIYSLGVSGANVTAATLDTGLNIAHPEFSGRVLTGYNAFDGSTNVADGHGHGTHVTGTIGAGKDNPSTSGMFGVAYSAYLLPVKVLNDAGGGSSTSIANGINWVVNGATAPATTATLTTVEALARKIKSPTPTPTPTPAPSPTAPRAFVMNFSLGISSELPSVATALQKAVTAGIVTVAAAGNNGGANPIWPARYAKETWANGQIIAVGAVDASNNITSWSARAGDTSNFYLVAPGVGIYSTYGSGYASLSGTSMAAPHVTGAVVLLKSGWPYLTAPQVTSILFTSATDLGAPGVDAVYGRGLLNLERAVQPIGALGMPSSNGTVSLSGTSMTTSSATGGTVKAGRDGQLRVAGFDSYGRDYQVDLAPTVRKASSANDLSTMLTAVDSAREERQSRDGMEFRVAYRSEATQFSLGEQSGFGAGKEGFAMSATDAGGREWVFGVSGMGMNAFGLAGELARRGETQFAPQLANPYFSLAQQYTHAGIGLPLTDGLRVKVGMLVSDPSITLEGVPQITARRQNMTLGEVSGQFYSGVWTVGLGRLQESGSVLGTVQTGALGFAGTAGTTVASFGVAMSPVERLRIGAQYTVGYTDALANRVDSLVTGYSGSRSEAYAVFASLHEPFGNGDRLSLTVSQPMRAVSGQMQMLVAGGADAQGAPVMQSRSLSLRPDGREIRTDLLYTNPINRDASIFLGVSVRNQPDHDATASRQVTVGTGIRVVF